MMSLKRGPLVDNGVEPWLDWHARTLRKAGQVCKYHGCDVTSNFFELRTSWAEHIARLGFKSRQPHLAHFLLLWRPIFWWREQQLYASIDLSTPVKHAHDWGQPRRFENGLATGWVMEALKKY